MSMTADLTPLFSRELRLCKIGTGDVIALLAEARTRCEYIGAATGAALALGAEVFTVTVPSTGWDLPSIPKGMGAGVPCLAAASPMANNLKEALIRCQLVLDLIPETIIHIPMRIELQKAGVRIFTVVEPPDVLERMFPSEEIRRDVEAMAERVRCGGMLHVTSDAGTDLRCTLGDAPVNTQYGYTDTPGHWDHWPSALVTTYPNDGSGTGVVVLDRGDILYPLKQYVQEPVRIAVAGGRVQKIEGGADAIVLQSFLDGWGKSEVYSLSHIGIGMHPRAQWSGLAFYDRDAGHGMDGRCASGGFLFTTGPNRYAGRLVEAHIDAPLHGCTVQLGNDTLVANGSLVS